MDSTRFNWHQGIRKKKWWLHFSKKISHVRLKIGLFLSCLCLMVFVGIDQFFPQIALPIRQSVIEIFSPLYSTKSFIQDSMTSLQGYASSILNEVDAQDELRRENEKLQKWKELAQRLQHENKLLRIELNYKPDDHSHVWTGRIFSRNYHSSHHGVIIDLGQRDGIDKGQAVFTSQGLIGRVREVAHQTSRVVLLTDPKSKVPVMIERTQDHGILMGNHSQAPHIQYLQQNDHLSVNDRVVTSGEGGLPAGIPVGMIESIEQGVVRVKLFCDINKIDIVRLIELNHKTVDNFLPE